MAHASDERCILYSKVISVQEVYDNTTKGKRNYEQTMKGYLGRSSSIQEAVIWSINTANCLKRKIKRQNQILKGRLSNLKLNIKAITPWKEV